VNQARKVTLVSDVFDGNLVQQRSGNLGNSNSEKPAPILFLQRLLHDLLWVCEGSAGHSGVKVASRNSSFAWAAYGPASLCTLLNASRVFPVFCHCHGLDFNDNGTLRVNCAQANDGVAEWARLRLFDWL
jgi:hypothetical protein